MAEDIRLPELFDWRKPTQMGDMLVDHALDLDTLTDDDTHPNPQGWDTKDIDRPNSPRTGRVEPAESLMVRTKSQTAKDSAGREYCYEEGKGRVPCNPNGEKPQTEKTPTAEEAAKPKTSASDLPNYGDYRPEGEQSEISPETAKSKLISIGKMSKKALMAAGFYIGDLEETAIEWAEDKLGENVKRLPHPLDKIAKGVYLSIRASTKAAFVSYTLGQRFAAKIAEEKGLSKEQQHALKQTLAFWDVAAAKPAIIAAETTGAVPLAVAGLVPVATTSYVLYNAATHTPAVARAAWKTVGEVVRATKEIGKVATKPAGNLGNPEAFKLPDLLPAKKPQPDPMASGLPDWNEYHGKALDYTNWKAPDDHFAYALAEAIRGNNADLWWMALYAAACDQTQNPEQALEIANKVFKENSHAPRQEELEPAKVPEHSKISANEQKSLENKIEVEIRNLDQQGKDVLVGKIIYHNGRLLAEPPSDPILLTIVGETAYIEKEYIDPAKNPERWIRNLYLYLKSAYLRASKPIEAGGTAKSLDVKTKDSYFSVCERDENGRCLPSGTKPNAPTMKPDNMLRDQYDVANGKYQLSEAEKQPSSQGSHNSLRDEKASSSREKIISSAKSAPVTAKNTLGGGANDTFMVTTEGGFQGVWKPVSGEAYALRDNIPQGEYYIREALASDVADVLGLDDLVPATFIREIDGEKGSVQQFVPDSQTALEKSRDGTESDAYDGETDLARSAAFDYLIGQTDRHSRNWMVTDDGKLVLIDNGLAFPERNTQNLTSYIFDRAEELQLPVPDWVENSTWEMIEPVLQESGISDEAIKYTQKRYARLKKAATLDEVKVRSEYFGQWDSSPSTPPESSTARHERHRGERENVESDLHRRERAAQDPRVRPWTNTPSWVGTASDRPPMDLDKPINRYAAPPETPKTPRAQAGEDQPDLPERDPKTKKPKGERTDAAGLAGQRARRVARARSGTQNPEIPNPRHDLFGNETPDWELGDQAVESARRHGFQAGWGELKPRSLGSPMDLDKPINPEAAIPETPATPRARAGTDQPDLPERDPNTKKPKGENTGFGGVGGWRARQAARHSTGSGTSNPLDAIHSARRHGFTMDSDRAMGAGIKPKKKPSKKLTYYQVKGLAAPQIKESYFNRCERDDEGHCLPEDKVGNETGEEHPKAQQDFAKPGTIPEIGQPVRLPKDHRESQSLVLELPKSVRDSALHAWQNLKQTGNTELAKEMDDYIKQYTDSSQEAWENKKLTYRDITGVMRSCPPEYKCLEKYPEIKTFVDHLETMINAAGNFDEPVAVYRGVVLDEASKDKLLTIARKCLDAKTSLYMPSLTSLSADPRVAGKYAFGIEPDIEKAATSVMLQVKAKSGLWMEDATSVQWEYEVLQSSRTRYKVIGISDTTYALEDESGAKSAPVTTIYLEEEDEWRKKQKPTGQVLTASLPTRMKQTPSLQPLRKQLPNSPRIKTLSSLGETTGGALIGNDREVIHGVRSPWQRKRKTILVKSAPTPPTVKESYFSRCERDDQGHCLPEGGSGSNSRAKPEGVQEQVHEIKDLFAKIAKPDGGFTYHPYSHKSPTKGYALSPYPERSWATSVTEMKPVDILRFARKNKDLLQQPNNYIGAWHDPASGKVFLDVSVVNDDEQAARKLALEKDQIAYFDLEKMTSVTVNKDATSGGAAKNVRERQTKIFSDFRSRVYRTRYR